VQRIFDEYQAASRLGFDPFLMSMHRGVFHAWRREFAQAHDEFRAALACRPDDAQVRGYPGPDSIPTGWRPAPSRNPSSS